MVEHQPSKLNVRVRFSLPAPYCMIGLILFLSAFFIYKSIIYLFVLILSNKILFMKIIFNLPLC